MTREKYFTMMEQLGKDPKEHEIPPDGDDLPEIIVDAINTFNLLNDRIYGDVGYIGKDYSNLSYFIEIYQIEDKEYFLEILHWLDSRAIKKSSDTLKREHDKLKRKNSGRK